MQKLPSRAAVATFSVALTVIGAMLPAESYARIKGPVGDTFSAGCLQLQNAADALRAEYKTASMARREEILQKLRNIGSDWIAIGCRAVFGSIALTVRPPVQTGYVVPQSLSEQSTADAGGGAPSGGPAAPAANVVVIY